MTELDIGRDERLALKAEAHHLNPVVLLGAQGLSAAVIQEIDRALTAHGLIKVKVPGDDRVAREAMHLEIATVLGAARIGAIGKLLILYRPKPESADAAPAVKVVPRQPKLTKREASQRAAGQQAAGQTRPARATRDTGRTRAAAPAARRKASRSR